MVEFSYATLEVDFGECGDFWRVTRLVVGALAVEPWIVIKAVVKLLIVAVYVPRSCEVLECAMIIVKLWGETLLAVVLP